MGKVVSSYPNITLGVSEQVPQDRRPGQHFAQDNLISDPVRGLARRHGSVLMDENILPLTPADFASLTADTVRHKEFTYFVDGVEYALIYRSEAADSPAVTEAGFAWNFNKDTRKFIPIVYAPGDSLVSSLLSGGVSAQVNVGKYIYLAGNTIVPSWVPSDKWGAADNKSKLVVWVRGGAYSRKFEVTLTRADATVVHVEYTTKSSSYPILLDTSDIPSMIDDPENPTGPQIANPNYQKLVNDRTNAYNSAQNQWIGEAARDQSPENIATNLGNLLTAAGVTGVQVIGSHIAVDNAQFTEISSDDNGDQSLMRAVGNQVSSLDLVSQVHWVGKVVKIRPKKNNGDDAFYLKAVAQDGVTTTGFTEVRWVEAAGFEIKPVDVFVMGTVVNQTLYLASTAAGLTAIAGGIHPEFKANAVGDDISSPVPFFFGRSIDYLGMFQDRLVIGSGATLFFSRPGDYFNWFRTSALTVDPRDPIEIYALGSEDDTIKTSTTYDRNLLLFGKRMQYTVNGRQPLVPATASITIQSAHEDAIDAEPMNSGNFVFYTKLRNGIASVYQIQMGMLADSPESYNVSQQLDRYLTGRAVQLLCLTSPNQVFLRTEADRYGLFTYAYLDSADGGQRLFDAWSRWTWDQSLGPCVGVSRHEGDVLAFTVRRGPDRTGVERVWVCCDRFVMDTGLSENPYLDSLRPATSLQNPSPTTWLNSLTTAPASLAYKNSNDLRFIGTSLDLIDEFVELHGSVTLGDMMVGVDYEANVTPTNPYVRDQEGKAVVSGRLTLGRVMLSIADTGGLTVEVTTANDTKTTLDFNGRLTGRATNMVGRQPIVTTSVNATVGREVRACTYTIRSKKWLPLTITAIEWVGQLFNNARRV